MSGGVHFEPEPVDITYDATKEFEQWLKKVDLFILAYAGLSHRDLADQTWRDWFDSGYSPSEAAGEALENEGFPFDE